MFKTLVSALLLTAGLASAQTYTTYTLNFYGECDGANSCGVEYYPEYSPGQPASAPQPEPFYYPSAIANYDTGLNIPISFHTGSVHPQIPTPQFGTGCQVKPCTFEWSDGGGNKGTITLTSMPCRFDVWAGWPDYAVSCNGTDEAGNNVSFTHVVYLIGPLRYGYWNWRDGHGKITISILIIGGTNCRLLRLETHGGIGS